MTPDDERRAHRVLASDSRARLLGVLRQMGRPVSVSELSDATGLHENTVRGHLDLLVSVGYATREREHRSIPGRPRIVYRATLQGVMPEQVPDQRSESMQLMARVLAAQVAGASTERADRVVRHAQAWARDHGDPVDRQVDDSEAALSLVTDLMALRGFDPTPDVGNREVVLHACPYADLARDQMQVICGVHLGLVRGALERADAPVTVRFSAVDPETPRCVVQLVDLPSFNLPEQLP